MAATPAEYILGAVRCVACSDAQTERTFTQLAKKHQMVDRMALRFRHDEGGRVVVEGEGANRVGRYTIRGTCARSEEWWDLELTRTYTPLARPLQRAESEGLTCV